MEKFAIDLDRVLDEFEFNEDCAEQVVSSRTNPEAPPVRGETREDVRPVISDTTGESRKKYFTEKENSDSTNDFYGRAASTKNHNRYDERLNQPNIKPSVSNVFSSLNDYINAPGGNVEKRGEEGAATRREIGKRSAIGRVEDNRGEKVAPSIEETRLSNKACRASEFSAAENVARGRSDRRSDSRGIASTSVAISVDPTFIPELKSGSRSSSIDRTIEARRDPEHSYENVRLRAEPQGRTEETRSSTTRRDEPIVANSRVYENVGIEEVRRNDKNDTNDRKENTAAYEKIYEARDSVETPSSEPAGIESRFQSSIYRTTDKRATIGFTTALDDLSEDDLKKYLEELEAEERAREMPSTTTTTAVYENVGRPRAKEEQISRHVAGPSREVPEDEEDAIFETVTIGVLPTVSGKKLQEKAKKFPVIDYSKQQGCSSGVEQGPGDFLEKKMAPDLSSGHSTNVSETVVITEERSEETTSRDGKSGDESEARHPVAVDTDAKSNHSEQLPRENETGSGSNPGEDASSSEDEISRRLEARDNDAQNGNVETGSSRVPEESLLQPETVIESSFGDNFENSGIRDIAVEEKISSVSNVEDECSNLPTSSLEKVASDGDDEPVRDGGLDVREDSNPSRTLGDSSSISASDDAATGISKPEDVPQRRTDDSRDSSDACPLESGTILGKQPPFWIPDNEAPNCMLCDVKFTVIKRRHHCRACGKVLCNKCCSMKYRLEYQGNIDSRVCSLCYQLLVKADEEGAGEEENETGDDSSSRANGSVGNVDSQGRRPNPNNPMEYCSTIPPLQQLGAGLPAPPTVMVPVGVLKREGGSSKQRPEGQKSVMFSDGIRPGCDLTELDASWEPKPPYRKMGKRTSPPGQTTTLGAAKRQNSPPMDPRTDCYIPEDPDSLPPTVTIHKGEITYHEVVDPDSLYKSLKNECEPPVMFAINRNLYAYVKITNLNCCVNKICWNVTSRGLACVGQDEIILLVETLPDETRLPRDLLVHVNQIYIEAIKGNTITELGVSIHQGGNFLGSREHAGFLFVRQTLQCLQKIILPPAPFLLGLLVHRWETPWAKIFPLRLMLRLGAEYRYYPCPLVSVRFRDAVYFEIGHTIMKVLADFRNFAYTLPGVRGLTILMHGPTTDVLLPKNRYDQVIKGLNNSNDHVLAFASNFSVQSDSHLVCIQTNSGDESNYQTQAINIQNKPRKVTAACFIVINGALKSSMGLSAKSTIVEDGLMVQIMPEKMEALKASLKNMQDFSIGCGLQGAPEPDETVNIKWVENDVQFNLGVKSPIDGKPMDGIPSIRVHNGTDYVGSSRSIRWTEVFIIKSDDHPAGVHDPVDINKLSENIARATCAAFVKLLDLLATAGLTKIGVRTTIHPDNVGYEAGSEGTRLPPIYMNSLDNELIQVLHKAAQVGRDANTVLELIFHVLDD